MAASNPQNKPSQRDYASVWAIAAAKRLDPDWLRGDVPLRR